MKRINNDERKSSNNQLAISKFEVEEDLVDTGFQLQIVHIWHIKEDIIDLGDAIDTRDEKGSIICIEYDIEEEF